MKLYGIDGCSGGWVVAAKDGTSLDIRFQIIEALDGLFAGAAKGEALVAIDIPIGLPNASSRECDRDARRFLGQPRGSSVFPAPCRCCLGAGSYEEACARNIAAAGVAISRQCFGILPKIAIVDALMSRERQQYIREAHPEVAFATLAGHPMVHPKRRRDGVDERLAVLHTTGIALKLPDIQEWRRRLGRGLAHVDDLIDAAACVITAERIYRGEHRTFGGNTHDGRELRMEIVA